MRFVRYSRGSGTTWGVINGDVVHDLSALPRVKPSLESFTTPTLRDQIRERVAATALPTVDRGDVSVLAPVPRPGKIICVGMNYHDHAAEQDEEIPDEPLLFGKAPTTVVNPGDPVVHPADVEELDYEVELGVVIGTHTRDATAETALDHVAGYTVVNDISARDAQFADGQWFRGKSYDTFSPMGPSMVAGDAVDPNDLAVEMTVNGETLQQSSTEEFIFPVEELIAYISGVMTLEPGDVISTGTPGGVGVFRDPPRLLTPGDRMEATVEAVGTLSNPVVSPPE